MDLNTLRRKVKRQFGDEYDMIITDIDILDWVNAGQMDLIRNTTSNDVTLPLVANTFPVTISDRISIKRVTINNRAMTFTSQSELDTMGVDSTQTGSPLYYYYEGGKVGLWPTPAATDTYNVLVTYAKIPDELFLLSPWLRFIRNAPSLQYATFTSDTKMDGVNLNLVFDVWFDNPSFDTWLATRAKGAGTAAADVNWKVRHIGGGNQIELTVSNGTTIISQALTLPTAVASNPHQKFRCTFQASTGQYQLFTINLVTGAETFIGTGATWGSNFNMVPIVAPIQLGAMGIPPVIPVANAQNSFRVVYFWMTNVQSSNSGSVVEFKADEDLINIPTANATQFAVKSGQLVTIGGNPTLLELADNVLGVPELWHEDLVKYCLAQAHNKNRNYRGEDKDMQTYQEAVTVRRNEEDSVDGPMYKGGDPEDFNMDWYYVQ